MSPLLEVALNGARSRAERSNIPRNPQELATEAGASLEAGAQIVHPHLHDRSGIEILSPAPYASAIRAVSAAYRGIPISLTTSAAIEPDLVRQTRVRRAFLSYVNC